jgi:outer membrane protein
MMQKVTIALLMSFSLAAAAEVKIGLVDMSKAIQDSIEGKRAKKELENDFNKKKKDLEKLEADLKKKKEDFDKKALVLADDIKAKKQQELQVEFGKYQEAVGKNQMEIQKHEHELTGPIIQKIRKIIEDIAKKEGYTVVLEKSEQLALYSTKEIDLTDRVVKEVDASAKK